MGRVQFLKMSLIRKKQANLERRKADPVLAICSKKVPSVVWMAWLKTSDKKAACSA